jgi:CHAT domain-containing protein
MTFFSALDTVSSSAVAVALPPNSVLLEFVTYEDYDFGKIYRVWESDSAYAAITLVPDGEYSIVALGDAASLDSLVSEYHAIMSDALTAQWTDRAETSMDRYNEVVAMLYERLVAPLQSALDGKDQVFVSADGILNLLPFETLTKDGERYLIEDHYFVYLTSGRDLLKEELQSDGKDAIVIADPDYMIDPTTLQTFAMESPSVFAARGNIEAPECLASMVSPLPMTRQEGAAVARLLGESDRFNVSYLESGDAREGALKSLRQAPRVLHIATHGYFCAEADRDALSNPLLRSGLVLAGANRTIGQLDEERPDTEDGILTALEASGLNLVGTDLVVLSACQTGIGEVQSGEGVFGLRRAFQHAAARSVIMSMFVVPDESTSMLMERFYENWLSGDSKSTALRNASLSILNERRENKESTHPLYWGGFILVGDPN